MPTVSTSLNRRAAERRVALRRKKFANNAAKNGNNLTETAEPPSSPSGVDDFVSEFASKAATADETNQSIDVQNNSSVITRSSSLDEEEVMGDEKNSKPDQKISFQLNHVKRFAKVRGPKALASPSRATYNTFLRNKAHSSDKTVRWNEETLLDDTATVDETVTVDASRIEDEGFVGRMEGLFLNGIEGIEDGLASLAPACISPASAEGCQSFGSGCKD